MQCTLLNILLKRNRGDVQFILQGTKLLMLCESETILDGRL